MNWYAYGVRVSGKSKAEPKSKAETMGPPHVKNKSERIWESFVLSIMLSSFVDLCGRRQLELQTRIRWYCDALPGEERESK